MIIEFYKETQGKTLHIIRLSELLDLFGASKKVVKEISDEEKAKDVVVSNDEFKEHTEPDNLSSSTKEG